MQRAVQDMLKRGVVMPHAESVHVGQEVASDAVAPGAVIHPGCRLEGRRLSVGPRCVIGEEAPATLVDCQLDAGVAFRGGYASGAVFLADVIVGSGAHVRPGTLLEEQAACGHTVGLKQTVFLPFVVTGSLINFCDALLAGGTDRRNHSEIGSSFVHFNFTPHGDKATASLLGDVPRGVMIDQPPIFLGGQGGLVGPVRVEYGVVLAAGSVCRRDLLQPGTLVRCGGADWMERAYEPGLYGDIARIVRNNLLYIGNLHALHAWYGGFRSRFMAATAWQRACMEGARACIAAGIAERIGRLEDLAARMDGSLGKARRNLPEGALAAAPFVRQRELAERWPAMAPRLELHATPAGDTQARNILAGAVNAMPSALAPIEAVRALPPAARTAGTAWLQSIVDAIAELWIE